jgi:hypothetical protein
MLRGEWFEPPHVGCYKVQEKVVWDETGDFWCKNPDSALNGRNLYGSLMINRMYSVFLTFGRWNATCYHWRGASAN